VLLLVSAGAELGPLQPLIVGLLVARGTLCCSLLLRLSWQWRQLQHINNQHNDDNDDYEDHELQLR
jgi:hypothetical protein